ncbi:S22A5-like protein, partial [Mya arenaria]
ACGLGAGFLLGALLADYVGRRQTVFSAFLVMCAAQCLTAISQDPVVFIVCQTLVGFGAGCFIPPSAVLVLEYVGHDWRDICVCLLPWWLGPSLLSLGGTIFRHWRHLAIISGMAGLPLIGFYFLVFESSRWLLCNHKFSEAERVTKEVISCNCKPVPEVTTLFDIARACVLTTMHKKKYTYIDLISTSKLRKATFAAVFTWFPGTVVYGGLLIRLRSIAPTFYLNMLVVFATDVVVVISAILINKCICTRLGHFVIGRRWCLFLYAMSSGLISICILVLHVTNDVIEDRMLAWLAYFTKLGVITSLTLLALITMETYPTVIRTMGCAVGFSAGLIGLLVSDKLIIYLEPFHYTMPFLIYGGLMSLVAVGVLGYPETTKQPLPDILRCRHRNVCRHEAVRLPSAWTT